MLALVGSHAGHFARRVVDRRRSRFRGPAVCAGDGLGLPPPPLPVRRRRAGQLASACSWPTITTALTGLDDFAYYNVICLALPVVAWLWIERTRIATRESPSRTGRPDRSIASPRGWRSACWPVVAAIVLWLATPCSRAVAPRRRDSSGRHWPRRPSRRGPACGMPAAVDAVAVLYLLGLVGAAMALHDCAARFDLTANVAVVAGHDLRRGLRLATSYLWSCRRGLADVAAALRMPPRADAELAGLAWLVPANLLLGGRGGGDDVLDRVDRRPDVAMRLLAAQAALVQVASVALLARGDRRGVLQSIALQLGAAGAVLLCLGLPASRHHADAVARIGRAWRRRWQWWRWSMASGWANCCARRAIGCAPARQLDADRWPPSAPRRSWWRSASRCTSSPRWARWLSRRRRSRVIALTLAGRGGRGAGGRGAAGTRPAVAVSERGRTLYVYAAEIALALVFIHVRVTMPWLFTGFLPARIGRWS